MSHQLAHDRRSGSSPLRVAVGVTVSSVATTLTFGLGLWVAGAHRGVPVLARATGITSYLLLVALVLVGLGLSHPAAARWRRPTVAVRIRTHVSLAVFTLVFTVLHIVLWATGSRAGVGWRGALVPMGSSFRTYFVTFGVLGFYAGVAAGVAAAMAGQVARRVWWPMHKVALSSLILIWIHVLGGADARRLLGLYIVTGAAVMAVALSRYLARDRRRKVADLAEVRAAELVLPGTAPSRHQRRSGLSTVPTAFVVLAPVTPVARAGSPEERRPLRRGPKARP